LRAHFIENTEHYNVLRERVIPLLGTGAADLFVDEDDDAPAPSGKMAELDALFDDEGSDE